jgi:hypothetical protein
VDLSIIDDQVAATVAAIRTHSTKAGEYVSELQDGFEKEYVTLCDPLTPKHREEFEELKQVHARTARTHTRVQTVGVHRDAH